MSPLVHMSILLIPLIAYLSLSFKYLPAETCDMTKPQNRDFNRYYGLSQLKNPFTTSVADECNSAIIFRPLLPQAILKADNSASSFMVFAKFGTGKTLLRCQYVSSLSPNRYFKILILNKQINEYFERFVSQTATTGKNCETNDCLEGWSKNEFAQVILSLLVTQLVDAFQERQVTLPNISLAAKMDLIAIICFYYNEQGVTKLEHFMNVFLSKTGESMYSTKTANVQIQEGNKFVDKPLLVQFKKDLNKLITVRKDFEKLQLLLSIVEAEEFQSEFAKKIMSDNTLNDLTHFTQFMKNDMKRPVVFIIDSIDENQYFFQEKTVHNRSLELFCRSSTSQQILSSVMAQNFYLSLFYPNIDGVNIEDGIIRKDKFPVYRITWDTRALINYADYVLDEMNKRASEKARCKLLPDFKTLVNYDNIQIRDIINKIETPRELHYFMSELIGEMNKSPNDVEEPFKATYLDVEGASNKSKAFLYKRTNVQ